MLPGRDGILRREYRHCDTRKKRREYDGGENQEQLRFLPAGSCMFVVSPAVPGGRLGNGRTVCIRGWLPEARMRRSVFGNERGSLRGDEIIIPCRRALGMHMRRFSGVWRRNNMYRLKTLPDPVNGRQGGWHGLRGQASCVLEKVLHAGCILLRNGVFRVYDKYASHLRQRLFIFSLHDKLAGTLKIEQLQCFELSLDIAGIRAMAGRRFRFPGGCGLARSNLPRMRAGVIRDTGSMLSLIVAYRIFDNSRHRFHEFVPLVFSKIVGLRE
jgi:hypothetical protein